MRHAFLALLLAAISACATDAPLRPNAGDSTSADSSLALDPRSAGDMTVFDASSQAFGQPGPAITAAQRAQHDAGDRAFSATFIPAPAVTNAGLGPRFANDGCEACHVGDGRGRPPGPNEDFSTMLFRVSIPGADAHGGPAAAPWYGTQLELRAIAGFVPAATMQVFYVDSAITLSDGLVVTLHVPRYTVAAPYRPLPSGFMISPRVAPPNFGLGLLEAIPAAVLESLSTRFEAVAADVNGKVNRVWDPTVNAMVPGRFGLKANVGSLLQQTAGAFNGDMGITNSVFPDEPCGDPVPQCARHAPEASDSLLEVVTTYIRTLGVPARRNTADPQVLHGQTLFASAGCALCHIPTLQTGIVPGYPALSNQQIHPYTDLLVHDMGTGLADGRPDFLAGGREWRTPPLWGIGLTSTVNGNANFLHDGRARTLLEAILWHAGQAADARNAVIAMSKADRDALLAFLNAL